MSLKEAYIDFANVMSGMNIEIVNRNHNFIFGTAGRIRRWKKS